jgi:hypothetical protein
MYRLGAADSCHMYAPRPQNGARRPRLPVLALVRRPSSINQRFAAFPNRPATKPFNLLAHDRGTPTRSGLTTTRIDHSDGVTSYWLCVATLSLQPLGRRTKQRLAISGRSARSGQSTPRNVPGCEEWSRTNAGRSRTGALAGSARHFPARWLLLLNRFRTICISHAEAVSPQRN